jgi:hypothetical protein
MSSRKENSHLELQANILKTICVQENVPVRGEDGLGGRLRQEHVTKRNKHSASKDRKEPWTDCSHFLGILFLLGPLIYLYGGIENSKACSRIIHCFGSALVSIRAQVGNHQFTSLRIRLM